jgi:DNA-binding response OmpR family regulator
MKKILIVEDDQIVANIYRNKFSVEGYQVETAADGQAGLESLRSFRPDALILDLMLPKVSGVQLMKTIRQEPPFEKLPIIVFSNTYLTNMVQEAWKAGATKCLSKASCSPKQLIEMVRTTLEGHPQASNGFTPSASAPPAPAPPAAHSPPAAPGHTSPQTAEAEFQALRRSLLATLPATLTHLRALLQRVLKAPDEPSRLAALDEMYGRVRALTSSAGLTGLAPAAQVCDALEALLNELHEKPKHVNVSTLRTVASAIDFLALLLERRALDAPSTSTAANILVVDDEAISRRALTYALEKAKLKAISIEDPHTAYSLLVEQRFDLILLDVDMPGMNGHELCARLRELPAHKKTPVIFVTGLTDFENRANSMMSGGNDFIAKPFLFIELAVKALVYVLRGRLSLA